MFLKNYEIYLPVKKSMFPEVMKCTHTFDNLKKVDCLLFSCL